MTTNVTKVAASIAAIWWVSGMSAFAVPQIICHPETVLVKQKKKATFKVQVDTSVVPAEHWQLTYQWQKRGPGATNFVNIGGATNDTYTINQATTNHVAYYRVQVSSTYGTATSESAQLLVYTKNSPITVYGAPVVSSGNPGTCPGAYAGYVVYKKSSTAGWGWVPDNGFGNGTHTATDSTRMDTKVEALGYENDLLCPGMNNITTGHPGPPQGSGEDSKYRFTVYFPNNVPTSSYPLTFDGFRE